MKFKISLFATAFLLGSISLASAAATTFTSSGPSLTTLTGVLADFKASKNVEVAVNADVDTYAATSDHMNGNRVYASASGDPLLYFQEKTTTEIGSNVAATKVSTTTDTSLFSSGWSSL
jgi:hypothetical protein